MINIRVELKHINWDWREFDLQIETRSSSNIHHTIIDTTKYHEWNEYQFLGKIKTYFIEFIFNIE